LELAAKTLVKQQFAQTYAQTTILLSSATKEKSYIALQLRLVSKAKKNLYNF
jgi:hypothetical protein